MSVVAVERTRFGRFWRDEFEKWKKPPFDIAVLKQNTYYRLRRRRRFAGDSVQLVGSNKKDFKRNIKC